MRNAAGKFNHFQPALHIALTVGNHLAMFGRQHGRQVVHIGFQQFLKLKHHPRAALRIGGGPIGLHFFRGLHGGVNIISPAEADTGLHLAGIWVENIAVALGRATRYFSAD